MSSEGTEFEICTQKCTVAMFSPLFNLKNKKSWDRAILACWFLFYRWPNC